MMDDATLRLELLNLCANGGAARLAYVFIADASTADEATRRLAVVRACPYERFDGQWVEALSFLEGRDA